MFLFADTQIVTENFVEDIVEDINNILNSGEVPNLFANDEWEKITSASAPLAEEAGLEPNDNLKSFFVHQQGAREPASSCSHVPRRLGLPRALPHVPLADQLLHDRLVRPSGPRRRSVRLEAVPRDLEFGPRSTEHPQQTRAMSSRHPCRSSPDADEFFGELKRKFLRDAQVVPRASSTSTSRCSTKREEMDTSKDAPAQRLNKLKETNVIMIT